MYRRRSLVPSVLSIFCIDQYMFAGMNISQGACKNMAEKSRNLAWRPNSPAHSYETKNMKVDR